MKANELKFGNYIMISRTFDVARVQTITRHKIGYHIKDHEPNLQYARLHEIEPIDINENILTAFGFFKNSDSFCKYKYSYIKDELVITVFKNSLNEFFIDATAPDKKAYFKISSLHEFQQRLQDFIDVNLPIEKIKDAVKRDLLIKKQVVNQQIITEIISQQERKTFTIKI